MFLGIVGLQSDLLMLKEGGSFWDKFVTGKFCTKGSANLDFYVNPYCSRILNRFEPRFS